MITTNLFSRYYWMLLLSLFSLDAVAVDCDDKSPAYIKNGEKYFDIDTNPDFTKDQISSIRKIFKMIKKSRLTGDMTIRECMTDNDITTRINHTYNIKAEYQSDDVGLPNIIMHLHETLSNTESDETFSPFDRGDNIKIEEIKDNVIMFSQKHRKTFYYKYHTRTNLIEDISAIRVDKNKIEYFKLRYLNGYFGSETHMLLKNNHY